MTTFKAFVKQQTELLQAKLEQVLLIHPDIVREEIILKLDL